ncbi:MAG: DsrE family protein [Gemmatimonadales bacterium]
MARYVLVETKSPLEGGRYAFDLGKQLRELKHDVTVYLLQDAVFAARRRFEAGETLVTEAKTDGVKVLADEVSLRQRGLTGERLSGAVMVGNMGELADLLMERSDKAIWH